MLPDLPPSPWDAIRCQTCPIDLGELVQRRFSPIPSMVPARIEDPEPVPGLLPPPLFRFKVSQQLLAAFVPVPSPPRLGPRPALEYEIARDPDANSWTDLSLEQRVVLELFSLGLWSPDEEAAACQQFARRSEFEDLIESKSDEIHQANLHREKLRGALQERMGDIERHNEKIAAIVRADAALSFRLAPLFPDKIDQMRHQIRTEADG
jgi:hypothetical protein